MKRSNPCIDGSPSNPAPNCLSWHPAARALALITTAVVAAACAAPGPDSGPRAAAILQRAPALPAEAFGEPVEIPSLDEMIALTDAQANHFRDFYEAGVNRRHPPHKRIPSYLTQHLSEIEFGNQTLDASETIAKRSGNCMSLALVTTALAREAGVKVGWQLADSDPVYSSEGAVIYSANHIQVRLYRQRLDTTGYTFAMGDEYVLLDYFTDELPERGKALTEQEMTALVYQNLGVEAMADGDDRRGFWLLREALRHDPANPNIYNALAVLYRRIGNHSTAEHLFRFALAEFGDRLIVLRNYHKLLQSAGRDEEAAGIETRMLGLPDPDPYPVLALGDQAFEQGRTGTALAYYRKARDVAPYLHEIHWKIARVYAARGDTRRAERELEKARSKAWVEADKQRYTAKLDALTGTH